MDLAATISQGGLASFVVIGIAGILATDIWRWAGVLVGARLSLDSEALKWVRAVSTALVAGLVTRMIFFPVGVLADSALSVRLGSLALGILVFFLASRHLALGVFSAALALIGAQALGM